MTTSQHSVFASELVVVVVVVVGILVVLWLPAEEDRADPGGDAPPQVEDPVDGDGGEDDGHAHQDVHVAAAEAAEGGGAGGRSDRFLSAEGEEEAGARE